MSLIELKQDLERIANQLENEPNPDYSKIDRIDALILELSDLIESTPRHP